MGKKTISKNLAYANIHVIHYLFLEMKDLNFYFLCYFSLFIIIALLSICKQDIPYHYFSSNIVNLYDKLNLSIILYSNASLPFNHFIISGTISLSLCINRWKPYGEPSLTFKQNCLFILKFSNIFCLQLDAHHITENL